MEISPSTPAAEIVVQPPTGEHMWVKPIADERVIALDGDPADVSAARESIRLAFVTALQHLPPKQRSVLILCEVLKWQAAEVAELLEASVASVNSALQRARATLAEVRTDEPLDPIVDAAHQDLLARYVDAFERYDMDDLVALLRDDVVLSMPPWDFWMQGADELVSWFVGQGSGCRGARLLPLSVNGTGGFANYKLARPGVWEPFGIQVIEVAGGQIVGHSNFIYPELFAEFGLPPRLVE